jgi:hypothetical protein
MNSLEEIKTNIETLIEKLAVYGKANQLLQSPEIQSSKINLSNLEEAASGAYFLAGTIKAEDELRLKRMIFRISRGRAIPSFFNFESSDEFAKVYKKHDLVIT